VSTAQGCGAPAGGAPPPASASSEAIIEGHVTRNGTPVPAGYARLLNDGGEFVAEVPLGEDGGFRFFAASGTWTVRVLAPGGVNTDQTVTASHGRLTPVEVSI
jgi:hypothetical protein